MVKWLNALTQSHEHQTDWDRHILVLLIAYRSAIHETNGRTSIVFGRELKLPVDVLYDGPLEEPQILPEYASRPQKRLDVVHKATKKQIQLVSDRSKNRYHVRTNTAEVHEGYQVWLYHPARQEG